MSWRTVKIATAALLVFTVRSAFAALFVHLGDYGNEIDVNSIKREGELAYYIIRRPHSNKQPVVVNVIVNCSTRERAEKGNPPDISDNNEEFVVVYPDTPNAMELDVACGYLPMPASSSSVNPTLDSLAEKEAELNKLIVAELARPKKAFISPSTREVGYVVYRDTVSRHIEKIGTLHFPKVNDKSLYGKVVISIPIFHDGTIFEKDGGPQIEKTSGNEKLDQAAVDIVRRSAPFGKFPENMRTPGRNDVWVVIVVFDFTKDNDARPIH